MKYLFPILQLLNFHPPQFDTQSQTAEVTDINQNFNRCNEAYQENGQKMTEKGLCGKRQDQSGQHRR